MLFKQFNKPLPLAALILAVSPLLFIFAVLLFAVLVWLSRGHWPSYNNPDPKLIFWGIPCLLVQLCLMLVPVAFIGAIALAVFGRSRSRLFPSLTILIASVVSITVLIAYGRIDPGGFMNWLAD